VQKKLGCPRASLGSLSEAVAVFDPEPVKQIASELAGQLQPLGSDRQFPDVKHLITVVDGTLVRTLARIVQAAYLRSPADGRAMSAWRLHTHFEVERGLPVRIDVTGASNEGDNDERKVLRRTLQADRCYVLDRGYAQFSLFNAIVAAGSSYVCRVRDNSAYDVVEQRPLSPEAVAAHVHFDAVVRMGRDRTDRDRPGHPVRLIFIRTTPHQKRGKTGGGTLGPRSDGVLRIATNLLDVPAEVIAVLYQRPLDDRDLLPLPQAHPRLSALAEHRSGRGGDPGLLRHHRLLADRVVDRQAADQTHLRDDLLLLHRLGR